MWKSAHVNGMAFDERSLYCIASAQAYLLSLEFGPYGVVSADVATLDRQPILFALLKVQPSYVIRGFVIE